MNNLNDNLRNLKKFEFKSDADEDAIFHLNLTSGISVFIVILSQAGTTQLCLFHKLCVGDRPNDVAPYFWLFIPTVLLQALFIGFMTISSLTRDIFLVKINLWINGIWCLFLVGISAQSVQQLTQISSRQQMLWVMIFVIVQAVFSIILLIMYIIMFNSQCIEMKWTHMQDKVDIEGNSNVQNSAFAK